MDPKLDAIFEKFGVEPEYHRMVAEIKIKPENVLKWGNFFGELFLSDKEKLVIDRGKIYFSHENDPITNFGAVVMGVYRLHEIAEVRYEVELLIICDFDKPKIVKIDSLSLIRCYWIERLGVAHKYDNHRSIHNSIKKMAEFAPVFEIYTYSGWALNKPDTYIWGGREICARQQA